MVPLLDVPGPDCAEVFMRGRKPIDKALIWEHEDQRIHPRKKHNAYRAFSPEAARKQTNLPCKQIFDLECSVKAKRHVQPLWLFLEWMLDH